jgi:glycosyltransferase involved in cell wall biosynthesis
MSTVPLPDPTLLHSATAPQPPQVSIVVPMFNEAESVSDLVARVGEAMQASGRSFELIAVDDGSRDGTPALLRQLAHTRPWLRPVCLARNYGQSCALQAGFDRVQGSYVVTLDADLQNDPLDIPALLDRLDTEPELDSLSGWRQNRQDKALSRKLPSMLANRLISRTTGLQLHDYGCALKAYRRPIVDRIRLYGELHRFLPLLAHDAGARIAEVPVRHHARAKGKSKYGIDRTFRVVLDLVLVLFFLRYRQRPLHAFGGLGLWLATPGTLILAWLFAQKLAGEAIGGRPLLLAGVMLVLVGMQLVVAGLIGEVMMRIYYEGGGGKQYHLREDPETPDAAR